MMAATKKEISDWVDEAIRKKIRIVAYNADEKYSDPWIFWGKKADFYVAPERVGGCLKISLHLKGGFRLAFVREFVNRMAEAGVKVPNRDIVVWPKPDIAGTGASHVLSILLPTRNYTQPAPKGKRYLAFGAETPSNAVEVGLFYSKQPIEVPLQKVGLPVAYATLDNGDIYSVAVRARNIDLHPEMFPPVPVEKVKAFRPDGVPEIGMPKRGLKMLAFSDPAKTGVLQIVEIGDVTMSRNPAPSDRVSSS